MRRSLTHWNCLTLAHCEAVRQSAACLYSGRGRDHPMAGGCGSRRKTHQVCKQYRMQRIVNSGCDDFSVNFRQPTQCRRTECWLGFSYARKTSRPQQGS